MIIFFTFKSKVIIKRKERRVIIILTLISILLFEWFYNHPALRYGGYCLISSIIFLAVSLNLEKYKIPKKKLIKKFLFFVVLIFLIFISRNVNRIFYENKTYNYQPIKMVYYKIDPVYFETSQKIKKLILNYNTCITDKINCNTKEELGLKKIFNIYVIYKIND
jgi:hypothetical protein